MEYVANGNLLGLLERNRTPFVGPFPMRPPFVGPIPMRPPQLAPKIDQRTLLMMAKDVANGMDFLAFNKVGF